MGLLALIVAVSVLFRVLAWNYVKAWLASGWYMIQGTVEYGSVEELCSLHYLLRRPH